MSAALKTSVTASGSRHGPAMMILLGSRPMAGKLRLDAPDKGLDRVSDIPIRTKWIKDKPTAWRRNENACPGLGRARDEFCRSLHRWRRELRCHGRAAA